MIDVIFQKQISIRRLKTALLDIRDLTLPVLLKCKKSPCCVCDDKCLEYNICLRINEVKEVLDNEQ